MTRRRHAYLGSARDPRRARAPPARRRGARRRPPTARPSHAYLLHGPAGSGKRAAARAFAAELLARGAADPASARTRVDHGAHPDLTWVAPSGAHEMLRRDVDEAVVAAASRTPFEAEFRVFVLERADTMNDEAANALLKTLEEPAHYVVLLLLTDRPGQVLPTIASRCQPVRFDAPAPAELAAPAGAPRRRAGAGAGGARLSLGDGERALRARARRRAGAAGARGGVRARAAARPRRRRASVAAAAGGRRDARRRRPRPSTRSGWPRSCSSCPGRSASGARPRSASRPGARTAAPRPRRSTTASSSPGSGIATSPASPPARPSSPTTPTVRRSWRRTRRGATSRPCARRWSWSTTPARVWRST